MESEDRELSEEVDEKVERKKLHANRNEKVEKVEFESVIK